jgi:DNA-binding protein HU-beta
MGGSNSATAKAALGRSGAATPSQKKAISAAFKPDGTAKRVNSTIRQAGASALKAFRERRAGRTAAKATKKATKKTAAKKAVARKTVAAPARKTAGRVAVKVARKAPGRKVAAKKVARKVARR